MVTKVKKAKKRQQAKDFDSLSKSQQRVAIAKDVIAAINADTLRASEGIYLDGKLPVSLRKKNTRDAIKPDEAEILQQRCSACALGSMFLAKIKLGNQVTWGAVDTYKDNTLGIHNELIFKHLLRYFSRNQICLIESAYERHPRKFSSYCTCTQCDTSEYDYLPDDCVKAVKFGKQFSKNKDRMLAIMQNIIDHDGEFVPSVEYVIIKS